MLVTAENSFHAFLTLTSPTRRWYRTWGKWYSWKTFQLTAELMNQPHGFQGFLPSLGGHSQHRVPWQWYYIVFPEQSSMRVATQPTVFFNSPVTNSAATSPVITTPLRTEGLTDKPKTYLPDLPDTIKAGPMGRDKVKPWDHTAVTEMAINSHEPKDHTWYRYGTEPLSSYITGTEPTNLRLESNWVLHFQV